jgi:hypothetical protein
MSFLEPILAMLLGVGAAAAASLIRKNLTASRLLKYGPIVKKAYDIIDPVLDQNLARWDGSKVDLALDMAKNWLPQVAADKVRAFEASAPELHAAHLIAAKVDAVS